jgi:hypothetical protein
MTTMRLIPLALRSSLLLAAGIGLMAAPFVFGLGPAPIVTGIAVGTAMVALALAGTEPSGRGTLPVSAQAVYDRGIALGLLLAAVVFGIADEADAALVFGIAGVAALIVTSITRYTARPA